MRSSPIIALFSEPAPSKRGPSGFLVSILVHAVVCVLVALGLRHAQKTDHSLVARRYAVRIMDLRRPEPQIQWVAQKRIVQPVRPAPVRVANAAAPAGGGAEPAAVAQVPRSFTAPKPVLQTLVQPDVPPDTLIHQVAAIPQVLMWKAPDIPVQRIVPPAPQKVAEIRVKPTIDPPNHEANLADVRISTSTSTTKAPLPAPSTTSPIDVHGPVPAHQVPTTAAGLGKMTPVQVISLSDVQMVEGTVALPPVNEISTAASTGSLSPGRATDAAQTGNGNADSRQTGIGHGVGERAGNANGPTGQNGAAGAQGSANAGGGGDSGSNSAPAVVRIALPKDGKFGVVVVGSSVAEDYPETVRLWSGRLAYTVYLHVGQTRNWILQYSLPRSAGAAAAGNVVRPDAPWPYDILRPSIDADSNTDAIMVHGFVSAAGHFEQLAVVFPTELAETTFLLHTLQQWQFRPAMQSGHATQVEVLLIIPDETN